MKKTLWLSLIVGLSCLGSLKDSEATRITFPVGGTTIVGGSSFNGGTVANTTTFQSSVTVQAQVGITSSGLRWPDGTVQVTSPTAGSSFNGGNVANTTTFQSSVTVQDQLGITSGGLRWPDGTVQVTSPTAGGGGDGTGGWSTSGDDSFKTVGGVGISTGNVSGVKVWINGVAMTTITYVSVPAAGGGSLILESEMRNSTVTVGGSTATIFSINSSLLTDSNAYSYEATIWCRVTGGTNVSNAGYYMVRGCFRYSTGSSTELGSENVTSIVEPNASYNMIAGASGANFIIQCVGLSGDNATWHGKLFLRNLQT